MKICVGNKWDHMKSKNDLPLKLTFIGAFLIMRFFETDAQFGEALFLSAP